MIDPNILKILESTMKDPSFSIVISSFEQPEFCNKDQLRINVQQLNPNLEKIIENKENYIELLKKQLQNNDISIPSFNEININSIVDKTLVVDSILDVNKKDSLYISGLKGIIDKSIEGDVPSRIFTGEIKNKQVSIKNKDNPNLFNKTKFKIVSKSTNTADFIISVPIQVKSIVVKLTTGDTTKTYSTITDNKVTVLINKNKQYQFTLHYTLKEDLTNQDIECITTEIQKSLHIQFNNTYKNIPAIIPTIDERNKIYSSYELLFDTDADGYYTGVEINFKNFKRTQYHGDINIVIIGDKIVDTS